MGTDDAAVVDERLAVRGVAALRVGDATVMPEIIRGHTHAPTVMIAERAAELISRGG
jgi:choline dehydrogenase-like flavoprotein